MSDEGKPYVREMVKEAIEALDGQTTNVELRDWILDRYPETNKNTIQCQIIVCTVNHSSRIHYPENNKPRLATDERYDFLYKPDRGVIELYDPTRHGQWEIYERDDGRLDVRRTGTDEKDAEDRGDAFAAEAHLQEYLVTHLDQIEQGLELYADENDNSGVEYHIPVGRIDILAVDSDDNFVVIELKVSNSPDAAAGQVMRYKNWVQQHLASGRRTRGIILAHRVSDKLKYAIAADPDVTAKEYDIELIIRDVPSVS
jgi:hypothetical protein